MFFRVIFIAYFLLICATGYCSNINNATLKNFSYLINFVAWGDSLTQGALGAGINYPTALQQLNPGINVLNEGVGGFTSAQILTLFQSVNPINYSYINLIWSGRNDAPSFTNTLSNIQTMTTAISNSPFLVMSVINGNYTDEFSGTTPYNDIVNFNLLLASTYPNNYIDVRSYLVSLYNPSSPEDVIDHGHDVVPTSLRDNAISGTLTQAITTTSQTDFTVNIGTGFLESGDTLTIGSEKIYVLSVTFPDEGGANEVTNCTRGYAGSTSSTYSNTTSFTAVDALHLNGTGSTQVAIYVEAWLAKNYINSF